MLSFECVYSLSAGFATQYCLIIKASDFAHLSTGAVFAEFWLSCTVTGRPGTVLTNFSWEFIEQIGQDLSWSLYLWLVCWICEQISILFFFLGIIADIKYIIVLHIAYTCCTPSLESKFPFIQCGAAEATGLDLFVLLLSTLVCYQLTELIWAFFLFHKFSSFTPPRKEIPAPEVGDAIPNSALRSAALSKTQVQRGGGGGRVKLGCLV